MYFQFCFCLVSARPSKGLGEPLPQVDFYKVLHKSIILKLTRNDDVQNNAKKSYILGNI